MSQSQRVFLVPHTHWDREWYFTLDESRALLMHDLQEALDYLEGHPKFPYYVLDGQTIVVDDYLRTRPQDRERVVRLTQEGRLKVGPWLTQTDSQVVGAESIVRNLTLGLEGAREFGKPMMVGYIPDSFGQSASLPMILTGFGIDNAVFWRGRTERHGGDVNFIWKSPDGSAIRGCNIAMGYQVGKYLEADPQRLQPRMRRIIERMSQGAASQTVVVPCGHDQMPIQKNLPELAELLNELNPDDSFELATYEQYLDAAWSGPHQFAEYIGEFTEGKYARVHRSIFSSRMDIKMLNVACEAHLSTVLEPLSVIADGLGFEYPRAMITDVWRTILECHAHDSIGLCNSDRVNADIGHRLTKAVETSHAVAQLTARLIALSVERPEGSDLLFLYNGLPYPTMRTTVAELFVDSEDFSLADADGQLVEYDLLSIEPWDAQQIDRQIAHLSQHIPLYRALISVPARFPGLGYETFAITYGTGQPVPLTTTNPQDSFERDGLAVAVTEQGIRITDGDESVVVRLEESGDDGDSYNFSTPIADAVFTDFAYRSAGIQTLRGATQLRFVATRAVPATLDERARDEASAEASFEGVVEVRVDERFARVRLTHTNRVPDHRVRLQIIGDVHASYSIADNQFGVIEREFEHPQAAEFTEHGWAEKPIAVYPMMSFCALTEATRGVFVATRGLREYEVTGSDFTELSVTLFRSYGAIGKDNLTLRPGRASGIKVESPNSQLLGTAMEFEVAVGFLGGEHDSATAALAGQRLNTPDCIFQVKKYNDFQLNPTGRHAPAREMLIAVDRPAVLSAVKETQSGDGYAVRIFNPSLAPTHLPRPALEGRPPIALARLDETPLGDAPESHVLPPCGTATWLFGKKV